MSIRCFGASALVLVLACGTPQAPPVQPVTQGAAAPAETSAETQNLNAYFAGVFMRTVNRRPMVQGYLGIKKDNDAWDDISEARAAEDLELARADLARLREFDVAALDEQGKLSYKLFERRLEDAIADYEWRHHSYPVNQMFGLHSQVPAFLINFHKVDDRSDAEAYIERLRRLPALFAQLEEGLRTRQARGIVPPAFVFPMAIDDCRNVISGSPFEKSGEDSTILADFRSKVEALEGLDVAEREQLVATASGALYEFVGPAYRSLIATLEAQAAVATTDDGAWKLPRGAEYYAHALAKTTTTAMTATEIHQLGLTEVARIHREMQSIMDKVGFKGTLQDFFTFMRTEPRFYLPNTEEGRATYLAEATRVIEAMEGKLDQLFLTKPKAGMVVKRVEPFREESAGRAFYNGPSLDGKRPGIYYVNLFDMSALATYELEALAFHEGIPGHHMQNAIAMEAEGLPMFRRTTGYTAYGEGWGLYSELLGKEMGFYEDPYSDFGRLSMELWRACRLVIDTGIHHERWTREQAIEYLAKNTPGTERDVRKAVERYIVMPSQATAYKIGMMHILGLRERARRELGERFDIREFHDVVLTHGPVPLTVLTELVDAWLETRRGG